MTNALKKNKWDDYGGISPLVIKYRKLLKLEPEFERIINDETFPVKFAKNKHIASPLIKNNFTFLIEKGAVYSYFKKDDLKIGNWIAVEDEIIGTISNLWTDAVSEEYIESIEPVTAIAIPNEMSVFLHDNFASANQIGRMLIEHRLHKFFELAAVCRQPNAKKRYEQFIATYGFLETRIPLKYIASLLGIRMETLSRLRNQKSVVEF